ncbi:hypothetical protein [Natrinema sp. H-ect4]|uniref:hypothetical protein n=1 Tax=Natrinema sp. H-ect4 TaxID=3242699 RepID=UPI0035A8CA64
MGCDIHGLIEVDWYATFPGEKEENDWRTAVDNLGYLVGRSYDSFGCLFGVRNYVGMEPVAEGKGVPDSLSSRAEERVDDNRDWCHSFSYVTYEELQKVDWEEEGRRDDSRIRKYVDGDLVGKASIWGNLSTEQAEQIREGENLKEQQDDGTIVEYKVEREKRRDCLSGAWEWLIFELMDILAEKFGSENVRLVVWFDN